MKLQWKSRGPRSTRMGLVAATVVALVGVACSTGASETPRVPATAQPAPNTNVFGTPLEAPPFTEVEDPGRTLSTFRELNPSGPKESDAVFFNQLLAQDAIRPIYSPIISAREDLELETDDLVIGVSIGGDSRAYPIRTLRFREMVNDELGGVPILVTW